MPSQTFATAYAVDYTGGVLTVLDDPDTGGAYFVTAYPYTIDVPGDGAVDVNDPLDVSIYISHLDLSYEIERATFVGSTAFGVVFEQDGSYTLLANTETIPPGPLTMSEDTYVVCFLAGTMIATPNGERAVETLQPGDLVLTHDGRAAPVKWLFVQTVSTFFADPRRVAPVRVRAGALGENLPVRDLRVSADHALLIDGVLVHAGALVDGVAIAREADLPERFCYYHLELADHSLILAEGVPAETFIDNVGRRAFDNWRAYEAAHGADVVIAELDLPRAISPRQLPPELRRRLAARAAA